MDDEEALIRTVLAAPGDPRPQEAYADWLDEARDPRGEFIRLRLALSQLDRSSLEARLIRPRLRGTARKLPTDWLARLGWVTMPIEEALSELELRLPGTNYVVGFLFRQFPTIAGAGPKRYLSELFPRGRPARVSEADTPSMVANVEQCIRWEGDRGSHSNREFIHTPRLDQLVNCVLAHLEQVADSAQIWEFSLSAGHPFYPVQWDFAYLIVRPDGGEVFIGSSSD